MSRASALLGREFSINSISARTYSTENPKSQARQQAVRDAVLDKDAGQDGIHDVGVGGSSPAVRYLVRAHLTIGFSVSTPMRMMALWALKLSTTTRWYACGTPCRGSGLPSRTGALSSPVVTDGPSEPAEPVPSRCPRRSSPPSVIRADDAHTRIHAKSVTIKDRSTAHISSQPNTYATPFKPRSRSITPGT